MIKHNVFFLLTILILTHCATGDVNDLNEAPIANLGDDFQVEIGQIVNLHGGLSFDNDEDILTYRWTLIAPNGSEALLKSTNFIETQFIVDLPGTYIVDLVVNDGLLDSAPDKLTMNTAGGANQKPKADIATLIGKIPFGSAIMFDGSNSSDPEGKPITFDWLIEGAPEESVAEFDNRKIAKPTFLPDFPGEYEISLVVNDGASKSDPVAVVIVVEGQTNEAPIADAGSRREVGLGDTVQLDAKNSSDKEGTILTYLWEIKTRPSGSAATLSDTKIETPTFVADVLGIYEIELRVNDGQLSSQPFSLTIEAKQGNLAPTADAGADQNAVQGVQVFLEGGASQDPESSSMTYLWTLTQQPSGSSARIADPTLVRLPFTADKPGTYDFSLVVNDGVVDSAPDTLRLTVKAANTPPVAVAGSDISVKVGEGIFLDGTGSTDADNDTLTYLWSWAQKPSGSSVSFDDATSSTPNFTPDLAGTYRVSLMVNDSKISSAPNEITINVTYAFPVNEGDLVITEIMSNPLAVLDSVGEWFELYNPTNTTFELKNCVISDLGADSHVVQQSLIVQPLSYVTMARSGSPGFLPDYVWSGFSIANGSDEIILECANNEISNILLDNSFTATNGATLSLLDQKRNETDNDQGQNWCVSTTVMTNGDFGTPGAANMLSGAGCP